MVKPKRVYLIFELDNIINLTTKFAPGYLFKNDTTYRIITDHLGSVRQVVNAATGAVVQQIDGVYPDKIGNEYGNIIFDSNPDFQPFAYAGGLYDNQTKLVRFGARDYDPEIGRWTSKDPTGFSGGDVN